MSDRVRPGRVAIVAGALVALQVVVTFLVRPVPDAMVSLLGGPGGGVDRIGGLRLRYRPPADLDTGELQRFLAGRSTIRSEGGVLVLDFPGVAETMAGELVEVLAGGGLAMREVREGTYADELAPYAPDGVTREIDQWRPEDGGKTHTVGFLAAPTRDQLERTVAEAEAHGWRPAPGSDIAFERVESWRPGAPTTWRTYELATEVPIDGAMVASAVGSYDPNTNRPIVLLDFTRDGAARFYELTRRIAGRKLATVLGDRIRSAPIINGAIHGGRASITMGGTEPRAQERERDMLVAALSQGAVPRGGVVEAEQWYPPADLAGLEWVGRLLLGMVAGGLCGLVAALVIRVARPRRRVPERVDGRFPVRRLAVTVLAPLAIIGGGRLTLPGINELELAHLVASSGGSLDLTAWSVIALGVTPIITAFVIVELVALAVPSLRWRRHDPRGRVRLGQAVAVVSLIIALVEGYFMARYLESLSRGGAEVVIAPGWAFRIATMVSLAAGTSLLGVVAGMIREHGLGNGYGVVFSASVVVELVVPVIDDPAMIQGVLGDHALGLVTLIAIVIATAHVLRWRIAGGERAVELRMPTSGFTPLSDAGGLVVVLITLSGFGLGFALDDLLLWCAELRTRTWLMLALVVALTPFWSWVFSRPSVVERIAMQAGVGRPTWTAWARATLISTLLLTGVAVVAALAIAADPRVAMLEHPALAMLTTAVVLDIIDDARAHRRALAPAGVIHQIQYAGVIERVLADAGIPCHLHASHLRTLLAFFGPWAPVIVLVPAAEAVDARNRIAAVTQPAVGEVPEARVRAG